MAQFVRGDVVVVPFPFSDLSASKRRPALVLAALSGQDVILCQITSQTVTDTYAIQISNRDFLEGGLQQDSNARPNRLFTASSEIIAYKAGSLTPEKLREIIERVIWIIQQSA